MTKRLLALIIISICVFPYSVAQNIELAKTKRRHEEQIISHIGYTTSYNQMWCIPNWVAWELTKEETAGTYSRSGDFCPDPMVKGMSASTYDYSRSGYDRGHMAPAADMKWSQQAMSESFYLSNICPQNHDINANQWENLERRCRGWAKFHGKVWICCGPIVSNKPKTVGDNEVVIPSGFFKVICTLRRGQYQAIGFIFPNDKYEGPFWDFACTVDQVEEVVGHDFFFNLPDDIESEMERTVNLRFWQNN